MRKKPFYAEDIFAVVSPGQKRHRLEETTELCDGCRSQDMKDFLEVASKDEVDYKTNYRFIRLGPWNDLQYRARFCKLCRAIIWLLREMSVKKVIWGYGDYSVEEIDCGLLMIPHPYRHDENHGYSRIEIKLHITKTSSSFSNARLEDAFQISTSFLREPQMSMDCREKARATTPRPRLRPETCNYDLVRNWLEICHETHGCKCIVYSKKPMITIRLVDIRAGTIVPYAQGGDSSIPPYVCLSWVWGSSEAYDGLTSDRLPHAQKEGFLKTLRLPVTVSDAILFLERLGMHYLWVDLLCIVQDKTVDKELYIPLMGSIYAASEFTIIANGRNSVSDGLPGVRTGTRPRTQQVVQSDDLVLVSGLDAKFDNYSNKEQSPPWQKRAWTLQEKLLSPRCIVLGPNQMHWECMEASYCEETEFETLQNGTYSAQGPIISLFSWNLIRQPKEKQVRFYPDLHSQYSGLVRSYNSRDLSFDSDALNAFQGILNTLSDRTGVQFLWGLPCSLFEQNLLWQPGFGRKRDHEYPSWSWLNYRYSSAVDQLDDLSSAAAIRCYKRTDESLDAGEDRISIQPITNENQYPKYDPTLDITRSKARIVEMNDIPVTVRKHIRPNFHIIFWADAIRARWCSHSLRDDSGDLYVSDVGDDIKTDIKDVKRSAFKNARKAILTVGSVISSKPAYRMFGNDNNNTRSAKGLSMRNPKRIGSAAFEKHYRNDHRQMDCEVVKVLDKSHKYSRRPNEKALLIVEKNGVAERVGEASVIRDLISSIPWKQRLIILG